MKDSLTRMSQSMIVCAVLAGMSLIAASARAHVIPPEDLHAVAEAYRRANFVLNLNPVLWEQVAADLGAIGQYWREIDAQAAAEFDSQVNAVIEAATRVVDDDAGVEPMPRTQAAARLFEHATRAVALIGIDRLHAGVKQADDRLVAERLFREARGVLGSFDDVIAATDPAGFKWLGQSWLDISSGLGSSGLLGLGGAEVDRRRVSEAAERIAAYVRTNYGDDFTVKAGGRLAPRPVRSSTFDPSAALPIKLPPGHNINKQLPRPRQILNMAERGVDEGETALIALGDMAFDSSYIFGEPARSLGISCNTCHNKSITNPQLFIPGLSARPGGMDVSNGFFAPHANNGHFDHLDTPDLRGIRFLAPYGRNGRFGSLREFTRNVIVNEFNGPEPDPALLDGMIAYMNEFDFLSNPYIDRHGRLTDKASSSAKRGENIFHTPFKQMAGMSCATCHVPSANFVDHKRHDIGSTNGFEPGSRDRTMDTPTLLGIKHTPPYMHNGSLPTLRAVSDWFNDTYKLGLSERELADLTAYVETVGDGVDAYEDTLYTLEAEMEEFSFFLSAFEFLDQRNLRKLISTTFETIAFEIRAHKWDLQDWSHMGVLDRLAELMDEAYAANEADDRAAVRKIVREYRNLYAEHADVLK